MRICDGFEGAVVHRGTNSLRLIGEAGTPCLRKRIDVCLLQKGSSPVLCKKPESVLDPRHCSPAADRMGGGAPFGFSSPLHWVSISSGTQVGSTGMLVHPLFLAVPTKDRTEQEAPRQAGVTAPQNRENSFEAGSIVYTLFTMC